MGIHLCVKFCNPTPKTWSNLLPHVDDSRIDLSTAQACFSDMFGHLVAQLLRHWRFVMKQLLFCTGIPTATPFILRKRTNITSAQSCVCSTHMHLKFYLCLFKLKWRPQFLRVILYDSILVIAVDSLWYIQIRCLLYTYKAKAKFKKTPELWVAMSSLKSSYRYVYSPDVTVVDISTNDQDDCVCRIRWSYKYSEQVMFWMLSWDMFIDLLPFPEPWSHCYVFINTETFISQHRTTTYVYIIDTYG